MAEIKKVVIEAGGKEFNLSVEEAKALRDILNSTFVPFYQQPIVIERYPKQWGSWDTWRNGDVVYCSTSKNTTQSYCATINTTVTVC